MVLDFFVAFILMHQFKSGNKFNKFDYKSPCKSLRIGIVGMVWNIRKAYVAK